MPRPGPRWPAYVGRVRLWPPVHQPATWPAPARGLRLRLDLIAIARRVLGARAALDPAQPDAGPGRPPVSDLTRKVVHFLKEEGGPTAVEYAVMLALIVVVCIAAITALGSNANQTFGNVALNTSAS